MLAVGNWVDRECVDSELQFPISRESLSYPARDRRQTSRAMQPGEIGILRHEHNP
jgi:hypothetical protein